MRNPKYLIKYLKFIAKCQKHGYITVFMGYDCSNAENSIDIGDQFVSLRAFLKQYFKYFF